MADKDIKFNSKSAELLAKWYLRLNGYFIVDNFIVHAADDPNKIFPNGRIAPHTETDLLAIRFKFNEEITGNLKIERAEELIDETALIDFVIAEVKTGIKKKSSPNSLWIHKKIPVIEYILRYAGFLDQKKLNAVATKLADDGRYYDENKNFSIRLVLISQTPANKNWGHITNILFDKNIIDFFVKVWGMCWVDAGIGSASIHDQWDDLIKQVFKIINDQNIDIKERKVLVKRLLQQNETMKVINIDREILGGTPVFNDTRVPIKNLFDYLKTSETINEFLDDFPSVKREQVIQLLETETKH